MRRPLYYGAFSSVTNRDKYLTRLELFREVHLDLTFVHYYFEVETTRGASLLDITNTKMNVHPTVSWWYKASMEDVILLFSNRKG